MVPLRRVTQPLVAAATGCPRLPGADLSSRPGKAVGSQRLGNRRGEEVEHRPDARVAAVVVNALNPIYTRWEQEALALNDAAVTVARDLGATPMLPGNVYNYGREMPPVITDATPERPSTRKGEIRCRLEARMRALPWGAIGVARVVNPMLRESPRPSVT